MSLRWRHPHRWVIDLHEHRPVLNDSWPQSLEAKMDALLLEMVGIKKRLQPGNTTHRGRDRIFRNPKPRRFKHPPRRNRSAERTIQLVC